MRESVPGSLSPVTLAIVLMGIASLMSSVLHVGVRVLANGGMPSAEIVLLRTAVSVALTAPFVFRPGHMSWRTQVPHLHILRGALGTISMWSWYYALSHLPLGEATTLGQTTALFLVLGAVVWFREEVGVARAAALFAGLIGALIVVKPSAGGISFAAVMALASSAIWAVSLLMAKGLSRYDSAITISFYQPLTIAPWALLFALPHWVTPTLAQCALLIVLGGAAAFSNYCTTRALGLADASVTAPIDYTKILWSTVAAFMLFGEVPGLSTWIGGSLIVASTLSLVIYERRRHGLSR